MTVQNMFEGLEQDDEDYEADEGYKANLLKDEPDASADVGDSAGRAPHMQAARGTPAQGESVAWRPSLRGVPACRPSRVGNPTAALEGSRGSR
jgi:hypothetical protein